MILYYNTDLYTIDANGNTVDYLGKYVIMLPEYMGGTLTNVSAEVLKSNLESYGVNVSDLKGTFLINSGTLDYISDYIDVLLPNASFINFSTSDSTLKLKWVFDNGYYLISNDAINDHILTKGYDNNGNLIFSNVPINANINNLYPSSYKYAYPQTWLLPPGAFLNGNINPNFNSSIYYFVTAEGNRSIYSTLAGGVRFYSFITPSVLGFDVTYDLDGCVGASTNPLVIPPNATITNFDFIADTDYSFVFSSAYIDGDGFPSGTPIIYDWDPDTGHLKIGPITSNITIHVHAYIDPYSDLPVDGETDIPGSEVIPTPSLPGLGAVSAGVIGLFAPSPSQMQALANYMWTDFGGTGTTVEDILSEIVEALKRAIANPLDYVVGLNIIPSQGLSIGSDRAIRFGFTNSGISMPQLTSQYFVVDCGTLRFDALCGDTFLDYAPYSKFSIYLPYIGIKEVDANDFVGHTIGVIYHGDVVTGGVTAYITKDGSVMYQYSGCCALNVPLNADGWGSTIAGAVQIATSLVAGGFAGGAAGVAESAVKGAAAAAANPSLLSPKVQHSGAVSGGAGCMGVQTPFVIREAVRFHSTAGMNTISGYPSFYYKSLGSVSGYTVVLDVHLHGIPATSPEIVEIETLLKSGVIL